MENKLIKDLVLGFIKVHILYHASKEPIYGSEFQNELKRHGYSISYGTLYPIFHRLEREGYIESKKQNVKGKIRKYYSITNKGIEILKEAKEKMNELVFELNED
jgi:DNA-binding PadR family transcriptional regulator